MERNEKVRAFVFDFLSGIGPIPGDTVEQQLECDYLYAGLLDSLGVVELITTIEKDLGVECTTDDFENPRFKTVGGLIEIIQAKLA